MQATQLSDFPFISYDKIRYGDTDRQGHVNNAVFSTFLETGRVEFLYNADFQLLDKDTSFVIVSLDLKLVGEIHWPGKVDIGTGIVKIGNSSITIYQQIFQQNKRVAEATTVIVQVINSQSSPLSDSTRLKLKDYLFET